VYVRTQRFHCFGCGADGDVIDFVKHFDVCSQHEALQRLADGANIVPLPTFHLETSRTRREILPVPFPSQEGCAQEKYTALLSVVQQQYHHRLLASPAILSALWTQRGINRESVVKAGLGYTDGTLLQAYLSHHQTLRKDAQEVGLLSQQGRERLHHRLIIPELTPDGVCQWMLGRVFPSSKHSVSGNTSYSLQRYLGLSLAKPLLGYGRGLQMLKTPRALPIEAILVVEGAIDYLLPLQWKMPVLCVALLGTHASQRQVGALCDLYQKAGGVPVIIGLDRDEAGQQGTVRLRAQLESQLPRGSTVMTLPPLASAKDLGDLGTLPEGARMLQAALRTALTAGALEA
jgi:DNA primase